MTRADTHHVPVSNGDYLWAECSGEGPAVVLMHGAGMDSRLWDEIMGRVNGYTWIRYDARGLGRSTTPSERYWDVEDLGAVLDYFNEPDAHLVGLSMGGEAALDYALAYPRRVRALILIGTSVSGYPWPADPDLAAYDEARSARDAATLARLETSIWASMGASAPGGDLIARMVDENAIQRVESERFALFPQVDALPRLADVAAPTLLVYGERDYPEISVIARLLASRIPKARLVSVADADHYLPLRAPAELLALMEAALAGWPADLAPGRLGA